MVGIIIIIFAFIPESPWWLVSKGKIDKAARILTRCNGNVKGYSIDEQIVCKIDYHSRERNSNLSNRKL